MKKTLLTTLLAATLATPCNAELKFDWGWSKVPEAKKKQIEESVKQAALKYTESKYADFGPYNFLTSKNVYTVRIDENNQVSGYHAKARRVILQAVDLPMIDVCAFHEFAHAYDYELGDTDLRYAVANIESWNAEKVEGRATKKEYQFMKEIKDRIPKKHYESMMSYENVNNYYETYQNRGPAYWPWYEDAKIIK